MSDRMNWGVLGTGRIAAKFVDDMKSSKRRKVLAVGSRSRASADAFADQHDIAQRFDNYQAVVDNPEVQAVYISLPNHLHCEWSIKCAEAGKHILCEKPVAVNHAEAVQIIDAVKKHDVYFMEAFMYRCHPQIAKLRDLVEMGAIGEVRAVQANFSYMLGPERANDIRLSKEMAGGGIMDVGCYTMSLARLVAGAAVGKVFDDPIEVQAVAHIDGVDRWSAAAVKFPSNIVANLFCGCMVPSETYAKVFGTKGRIELNSPWFGERFLPEASVLVRRDGEEAEEIVLHATVPMYALEADILVECVERGERETLHMSWGDTLGQARALDMWREEGDLRFDGDVI